MNEHSFIFAKLYYYYMTTYKKYFLLIILCLTTAYAITAQTPGAAGNASGTLPPSVSEAVKGKGRIFGTVVDSANGEAILYATITLNESTTGKPVNGTVSDEKGMFEIARIPEGSYRAVISFLGYKDNTLDVKIEEKSEIDLGQVRISKTVLLLSEATVTGQRKLVEEKVDRTVYNAEYDATNRGGDATDVLRKVPMLSVDLDGNVTLRGSQNVKVLINNKPSAITANSIADALKQIPADLIKTVEVITSPSAKYDAEGSGGIINIITKKSTLNGFSLNVDGSIGLRASNLGLNGSYRRKKMGFSIGGFGRFGYNTPGSFYNNQQTINRDGTRSVNIQNADTRTQMQFGNYQMGWDYDISKNNSLSATVKYGFRNSHMFQDRLFTQTFRGDTLSASSLRNVDVADLSGTVDASLNFTHTFAKPQHEFSILSLYSRNDRTNDFYNSILNESDNTVVSRLKNQNKSFNQEFTLQADYQLPIGEKQLMELGAKNILRDVTSNYKYFIASGSSEAYTPLSNAGLSNVFHYNQNVTAGYSSYTINLPASFAVKAGARYEYTTIAAHFQDNQKVSIPSYSVLVPSINVSRKLTNGSMLKASYNRRIQRPSLQFLNPNVQASNPLSVTQGNPLLSPEYTNNYELGYSTTIKSTSLSLSTFARNTNNAIQTVRNTKGQDTVVTTYQNIGIQNAYGFNIFANVRLSNKFSLNGGPDVFYTVLNNNAADPLNAAKNSGWVISGRIFAGYNLTQSWSLQLFTFYRGKQVQLQGSQGGFGIYSLSLKKELKNQKGSFGLGAENFFTPSFKIHSELNSPFISQSGVNVIHNMSFKVNFSYRIGKMTTDDKRPKKKKSVNNDDLKESGDNNSPSGAPMQDQSGGGGGGRPGQAPAKAKEGEKK